MDNDIIRFLSMVLMQSIKKNIAAHKTKLIKKPQKYLMPGEEFFPWQM
jgi:hypothetical protein